MKLIRPDPQTLRAYVYGELSTEESAGVRRWLIIHADETLLEAYEELLRERRQREARLEHWVRHPLLARLEWRWAQAQRRLAIQGTGLDLWTSRRPAALATLGGHAVESQPEHSLEVTPGETVDYEVRPEGACYVAIYAIESNGHLEELHAGNRRLQAGEVLPLRGIVLAPEDEPLELFILSDVDSPIPSPTKGDGAEWLANLLEGVAAGAGRSALRRTLRPAGPGGKQS